VTLRSSSDAKVQTGAEHGACTHYKNGQGRTLLIKTTSLSIRNNKNRTLKHKIKARFFTFI
jgi:hypothetical protein